ncbi:MAG: formylglycine-generating enzyme family protein [Desulfobacterales bacterium]|nr:formylglycine-generating enzyme family protein [Desulfobacterales bacterium]MBF0397730.1 formylglycine-generating enzyme family protein [Desulfobacterales bacterium]
MKKLTLFLSLLISLCLITDANAKKDVKKKEPAEVKKSTSSKKTYKDPLTGAEFAYISAGSFTMGSPSNEPQRFDNEKQHKVTINKGFYIQTTEVTQEQWKKIMGNNPAYFSKCGENCPVEQVSWNDANEFIKKLNTQEGKNNYRLPTEAEWEYSCRAEKITPYSFGACLSTDDANYDGNNPLSGCDKGKYREKTTPAGSLKANGWGLFDMHGNVWEWCQDIFGDYTEEPAKESPKVTNRVLRGGSYSINGWFCRSAFRFSSSPDARSNDIGFRLVRIAD